MNLRFIPSIPMQIRWVSFFAPIVCLVPILAGEMHGQQKPVSDSKGIEFFEKEVRPLLTERCLTCHSRGSDPLGGNLLLDSRDGWKRGGDLGPAIRPGDPENSLLLKAVTRESDELEMPPDGKMAEHEIEVLREWIRRGAPDPRDGQNGLLQKSIDIEAGRKFWSLQPHWNRSIPVPSSPYETGNELDRFIQAKQIELGLKPAERGSASDLIRRVYFVLTGLPPTADETRAFLADRAPDALARVIDRLLASPRYGEKWGRHWLKVARYADSNGLDENIAHGNAWRYRDYVIRSLNSDKPFDRFIQEQIAGDLLPVPPNPVPEEQFDPLIATGFLSLGPKVLAEVDEQKMELDIIDEQVDTVGRAFLAQTFGCARCHDHKFDPVRTEDYYALAGIFKSTRTMEHFRKIARWYERPLATPEQILRTRNWESQLKRVQEKLAAGKVSLQSTKETKERNALSEEIKVLENQAAQLKTKIASWPTAMAVTESESPVDLPVYIRGSHLSPGKRVKRGLPAVLDPAGIRIESGSGRRELADWLTDRKNPLVARVLVNRIWQWHFGRGLVETADNFGRLGSRPSHPELLDWLANRFVEDGWSIKNLQRLILLSRTWQQSSRNNPGSNQDRENIWLSRAPVLRLEAEQIRDAMLATAGELDLSMGGSLLHVGNREFLFNHTSRDTTRYDSSRRAVYLPVIRNHLYDMFELFDYSDASVSNSLRTTTTVAPQALFLMNSELVDRAATGFARRLLDRELDSVDRHRLAYEMAFARRPLGRETDRDLDLIRQLVQAGQSELKAWKILCQSILVSNEFFYLK